MMVLRRPHLGQHHLPPEVAVNSGQIVVIAATTALVGATSPQQIARSAPAALTPVPPRHRAMVMHQHQRQRRLLQHRLRRSQCRRRDLPSHQSIATHTQLRHSFAQVALCAPIVAAILALAHDAGVAAIPSLAHDAGVLEA